MAEIDKSHIPSRGRIGRAAPLVGLAGRTAGEAVVDALRRKVKGGDSAEFHTRTADRYVAHLGRSKGVLMKAGQILSFTAFGPAVGEGRQNAYQQALARLQDNAPPMPPETARAVLEEELGGPRESFFTEFDDEPLGAASIGQVHAARLLDGRRVAVKIQYPGVEEAIRADLENTDLLATFLQMLRTLAPNVTRIDPKSLAREVSDRIGEEIDYSIEATNQTAFADAYRGHPFIHVPEVISELSTQRVLTMTLADGMRWADALTAEQRLRDRWAETIFRFSYGSSRRLGLSNADPHPGNYLFHDDGSVTFLDFGCVKKHPDKQVHDLKRVTNTAVDADADGLYEALAAAGFIDPTADLDRADVLTWFRSGLDFLTAPQPYAFSTEADTEQDRFSPAGSHSDIVRSVTLDPHYLMTIRIELAVLSVLRHLAPTAPWEAIRSEWDRGGPPATPMGEQDLAFRAASV